MESLCTKDYTTEINAISTEMFAYIRMIKSVQFLAFLQQTWRDCEPGLLDTGWL